MKQKTVKTVVFVALSTLFFIQCKKEIIESPNSTYSIKEYVAPSEVNVKNLVKDFLNTSHKYNPNNVSRNEFPATEVNEATWLMEATSNYLENVNLDGVNLDTVITFTVTANTKENGSKLEIEGSEMASTFDEIQNKIDNIEQETGLVSELVDYELVSADNNSAEIEVRVVIGTPTPIGGRAATWPAGTTDIVTAYPILQDSINRTLAAYNLANFGTGVWYTNINVINYPFKKAGLLNIRGQVTLIQIIVV